MMAFKALGYSMNTEDPDEINAAYEQITKERSGRGSTSGGYRQSTYGGYGSQSYAGGTVLQQVRYAIQIGDLSRAEALLAGYSDHNAEWNFLKGCVFTKKGYFYDAQKYFETACYMEPNNQEYRNALNSIREAYTRQRRSSGNDAHTTDAGCCEALLCTSCCCNCLGGNRFRCC